MNGVIGKQLDELSHEVIVEEDGVRLAKVTVSLKWDERG